MFQPGQSGNPAGKPRGAVNKINRALKEAFLLTFENLGGADGLTEWARENKTEFYKLSAKLLPQEMRAEVDVNVSLEDALERIRRSRPEIIDGTAERLPDIRAGLLAHQGQGGTDQSVQSEPRAEILTPEA